MIIPNGFISYADVQWALRIREHLLKDPGLAARRKIPSSDLCNTVVNPHLIRAEVAKSAPIRAQLHRWMSL